MNPHTLPPLSRVGRAFSLVLACLCSLYSVGSGTQANADAAAAARWAHYEPAFRDFEAQDAAHPPAKGGIVFVGSSIFRRWTDVGEHMAPLPVLNRAFGGSRTADQVARFDQTVLLYAPKIIVYYCGSNDLKAKTPDSPQVIFERFRAFSERVRTQLPQTWLIYVTATRSPDRVPRWEQVDHYNALVRAYCSSTARHRFVDINPVLVDATGAPRLDLYLPDKLHFLPPAYAAFTEVIKPVLVDLWKSINQPL